MTEQILRPDVVDVELETTHQAAERKGVSVSVLRGKFRRYAKEAPKPVKVFGRLKYFLPEEVDAFLAAVENRPSMRSRLEVAESEVYRITEALEEARRRKERWEEEARKATVDEKHFSSALRRAEEKVELERVRKS